MLRLFIKPFLDYCRSLCYAEKSIKELRGYIGALNEFINKQHLTEISQVQYNHLLNFVTSAPATASTIKARVWTVKKFYGFLMVNSYIKDNIAAALIPPKIPKKETRFLTGEELKIIFEGLHKRLNQAHGLRDLLIIALMATLGLRKATLVALDVDDFAQHLHPHIFRHAAATQLNETGGIDLTRQVLGHRHIENSRRYIHLSASSYGGYMKQHPYFRKERSQS